MRQIADQRRAMNRRGRWALRIACCIASILMVSSPHAMAVDYHCSPTIEFAGGKLVVAWPRLDNPGSVKRHRRHELLIHFHGKHDIVLREAGRADLRRAIAIVNFPGLSSAYSRPFEQDASLFERLLEMTSSELKKAEPTNASVVDSRIVVASFSAGYGAVREILKSPSNLQRIEGYIAADSIYAGIVQSSNEVTTARKRSVNPLQMKDFLAFARLAKHGKKFFLITHSAQSTAYASTTETADYLIGELGLSRQPSAIHHGVSRWLPASVCKHGAFQVLGYPGTQAADHLQHLRSVGDAFGQIPRMQVTMNKNDHP